MILKDILSIIAIILSVSIVIILMKVLMSMILKVWWYGVPFVRSKKEAIRGFIDHLNMISGQTFLDLGCGDGIVMASVLSKFPGVIARGYELVPEVYALSQIYQKEYGKNFEIIHADYFKADFTDADVIYCYLLPRLLSGIRKKIQCECRPGTKLYSNVFKLSNREPIDTITVNTIGKKDTQIFVYSV